ncbi:MAG: division/cell wall cluster transcriptional repressor MraZ [Armatimonadota bacterium]|nr:division/cell wall cluster transcriptional repressor MraZ [Armatimonadota bacterium]
MFIGEFEHSLDEKGRVVLPFKYRSLLGDRFYITKGLHGCLWIFPAAEWNRFDESLKKQSYLNLDAIRLQRFFSASAFEVGTDSQNRLSIPAPLREYAGIKGQAVIVGASNRVEVWSTERWQEVNADVEPEALAASAMNLGLGGGARVAPE